MAHWNIKETITKLMINTANIQSDLSLELEIKSQSF